MNNQYIYMRNVKYKMLYLQLGFIFTLDMKQKCIGFETLIPGESWEGISPQTV